LPAPCCGLSRGGLPDYRGSDESRSYVYPIPYLVYRGDRLRVDRTGARAVLLESQRFELDFSGNATPPVDSSKNHAREGMPDLNPTVEIGPQLNFTLGRDREKEWRFDLRLPVRAVMATDLRHARQAGYVAYPHLNLNLRPELLGGKWNLGLQTGALFATREYHRYFYGIDPQFATPQRPAYEASGGYSGAVALVSTSRRIGKLWMGGFVRYDNLQGAVFENSPLVKQNHSVMAGFAFAWVFAESERRVEANE
jgi:MipA family protein